MLSFLSLTACPLSHKETIVLQINSQKWTSRQFAKRLAQKIESLNIRDFKKFEIEQIKEQLIGELLLQNLIYEWAKARSIVVSKEELNHALEKTKTGFSQEEIFALYLKRKKISPKEWKKKIKNKLLYEKVSQKIAEPAKVPTEKEMRDYYQNHLNLFKKKPRILIHHLFHKKKALLLKIKQALKQEKDLILLSKKFLEHSQITPSKWVEKGTLEIFDKAFTLKINEISPIYSSPYAYHIVQVLNKKPAHLLKFSEVKEQISKTLLAQKRKALFSKWLDTESAKARVLKNESHLKKIKAIRL